MGWPEKQAAVSALGLASPQNPGKIQRVELLGGKGELKWKQEDAGLTVEMPADKISDVAITLKVELA
jgi:alpha-L-fucosidase